MADPSVLTYARYFNLTQNHASEDPITTLQTIFTNSGGSLIAQEPNEDFWNLEKQFKKAAQEYVSCTDDITSFAQQAESRASALYKDYIIHDMRPFFDELLPDPYYLRKLKLHLPLLMIGGGDAARDAKRIRGGVDLQLVIEDFLEVEDDNRDISAENELVRSSAVEAAMVDCSRLQLKEVMKKEKFDATMDVMRHIQRVLDVSIEPADVSKVMRDSLPRIESDLGFELHNITEDDFDLDMQKAEIEPADPIGSTTHEYERTLMDDMRESNTASDLDMGVDEEIFLPNTQADQEIDELFRQFTNHDTDEQDTTTVDQKRFEFIDEQPAAKKRKLTHHIDDHSISTFVTGNNIPFQTMLKEYKFNLPSSSSHTPCELPSLDLPGIFGRLVKSEIFDNQTQHLGSPPFRIPNICEALRESMTANSGISAKTLIEDKPVISSDKMIWKEPGLRVLDKTDTEDDDLIADDYCIEELTPAAPVTMHANSNSQSLMASVLDRPGHGDSSNRASRIVEKNELKPSRENFQTRASESVRIKQESSPNPVDKVVLPAHRFHADAPRHARGSSLSELDEIHTTSVQHCQAPLGSEVPFPWILPQLSDRFGLKRPTIVKNDVKGIISLLPTAKRKLQTGSALGGNDSILNGSVSSFLDLRGKQFKAPAISQISTTAEIINDPIVSTQDIHSDEWHSDELTLLPRPRLPAEPVQQEVIPMIEPLDGPRTIIMNDTLLQTKPLLVQFLERHDNTHLTLIFRDLDVKQRRGPDVILNPTTCLFTTNLQYLSQRPLPGQKSATGLSSAHDQVVNLMSNYSHVVVLVHHALSSDSATQFKTMEVQASFAAFCLAVSRASRYDRGQVQPYWLPCVHPASTSRIIDAWVWQVIGSYAYRTQSPEPSQLGRMSHQSLIQDETLWELFLRKAGLNPFAAQVVIGSLRRGPAQSGTHTHQEPTWGLRRLVAMSPQDRTEMFADLIGLDVVVKLNEVLSGRDSSTEHGI